MMFGFGFTEFFKPQGRMMLLCHHRIHPDFAQLFPKYILFGIWKTSNIMQIDLLKQYPLNIYSYWPFSLVSIYRKTQFAYGYNHSAYIILHPFSIIVLNLSLYY